MNEVAERQERVPAYAWVIFALTFGLLISDYMARQVLNAVFPLLKTEWALSDGQLGLLSGVVAIMVGLLTFPLSLLADRLGRVKSLTVMAVLWSLATLLCSIADNYGQMLAGRLLVGVGEAAYGSVGIALVVSVFPKRFRQLSWRAACLDRCLAWASAAQSQPRTDGGWPSWRSH
jgi:MFS family permease